ncbi:MAG TPA: type II toxin-antitoxin system RelE/ParE family toxin [Candidatus Paceibacterota bacterium]|nr:type II toxin-antitoxin system RelE/ParE family toxin [Candidatus Paceibacterota bacterium]
MDKIDKFLRKIPGNVRRDIFKILGLIKEGKIDNLDIKKLKGKNDIFRVRKGDIRIIYRVVDDKIYILAIEKKGDNTYNL